MGPGLDFLVPIFGILVVLVPIIGVTTVLTLRLGLKPFIETLARELRGMDGEAQLRLQVQVEEMGEQLTQLNDELRRLREAQEFDQRLLS
jgi:hypothetical protein